MSRSVGASAPVKWPTLSPDESAETALVRLAFSPGSNALEPTHAFLTAYATERFRPALATRINVAVYELLSNALTYGSLNGDSVLELVLRRERVLVRVSNDAIAGRVTMLREQLGRIVADAEGTFLAEFRRSASGGSTRSMLGLARVAHEVRMDLEFDVSGPRVVVAAGCSR